MEDRNSGVGGVGRNKATVEGFRNRHIHKWEELRFRRRMRCITEKKRRGRSWRT